MDERILKAIICSCESATKDLENSKDFKKLKEEGRFLPTSNTIFNALCTSLTKLLSYKVSKEAYQRYTVRLHVIEVLRDWCKIKSGFENVKLLRDEKHTSTLLQNILVKYLTDDLIDGCDSNDNLLPLTGALMCLAHINSFYNYYVEKLLLKLAELENCEQSEYLLCYAVQKNANLNLQLSTIEKVYQSQKSKLIEQPLLNDFMSSCTILNKDDDVDTSESVTLLHQLFEFASESPHIFLLVCAFLKELQVQLDHAPKVIDFVQLTLKHVKEHCEKQGRNILDLYPRHLQSLVILLQIEPTCHTDNSKSATLRILRDIYIEDENTVIMLLSHFPLWLKLFGELISSSDIR